MRAYIELYVDDYDWEKKEFEKYIKKWIKKIEREGISPNERIGEQIDIKLIQIKED